MKNHTLKIWPEYFQAVLEGRKTFELRKRKAAPTEWGKYQVGERVMLNEWDPEAVCGVTGNQFTGRWLYIRITYILNPHPALGLMADWLIFGFEDWNKGGAVGPQVIPGHEPNRRARIQELVVRWLGPSSNKLFGRGHWTERKGWNDTGHQETWLACQQQKIQKVNYLVDLEFFPHTASSGALRDSGNNALSAKIIEDGLVKAKILVDDSPKYVRKFIVNPTKRSPEVTPWDFTNVKILEVI